MVDHKGEGLQCYVLMTVYLSSIMKWCDAIDAGSLIDVCPPRHQTLYGFSRPSLRRVVEAMPTKHVRCLQAGPAHIQQVLHDGHMIAPGSVHEGTHPTAVCRVCRVRASLEQQLHHLQSAMEGWKMEGTEPPKIRQPL